MHGNVFEWCLDSYAAYLPSAVSDPFVTGGIFRVIRGGGWNYESNISRSAFRIFYAPAFPYFNLGFRVVLAPILVP
jgi:formylglycine-generating enzyme required for sulfatase activity